MACKYLVKKGYKIVGRNFHCRYGEIDIIARDDEYICFVEVKTRTSKDSYPAVLAVTNKKQKKIILTATHYLQQRETDLQPRMDVCEVYFLDNRCFVNYIEDAFGC